jgi:hypothetical protein
MRSQIADRHLTYIGSGAIGRHVYDVYHRDGGPQLGEVERKTLTTWWATTPDGRKAIGRTRWEAATTLWRAA